MRAGEGYTLGDGSGYLGFRGRAPWWVELRVVARAEEALLEAVAVPVYGQLGARGLGAHGVHTGAAACARELTVGCGSLSVATHRPPVARCASGVAS